MGMEELRNKRIAILSPVAWRTPPRAYGAWETVASNITEGLVARGWRNVTLFATADSITKARLVSFVERGYEEDKTQLPPVSTCLHISKALEMADEFDLIHNNFDYLPLTYARFIRPPMLTTVHGFSDPGILPAYHEHKDSYFVSISDSDRDKDLPYLATVYNGIDISQMTFRQTPGDELVFLGRIHADKGTHLAIELAKRSGMDLIIAGIIQDQDYFDMRVKPHVNGKSVRYIGPVNPAQRDDLFQQAYAVVHLNTIPERFGLVMAEAMAAGVPVIAQDLGSCREVVAHGETGFVVASMHEAVEAVKRVPQIDRRACRRRVEENFTIDKMVEGYEKVYAQIFQIEEKTRRS
jgi:glycosyltransferase involved in cell wall biosynthesis